MTVSRDLPRPLLVPELNITSLPESLRFWRDLLGFRILYDRPEQGFAAIERDGVEFMLEEYDTGPAERLGIWDTGAREKPYGRGINFEITVADVGVLMSALEQAGWPLFFGPEERWYRPARRRSASVNSWFRTRTAICCVSRSRSAGAHPGRPRPEPTGDRMFSVEVRDRIMIGHSLPDPFFGPAQACTARPSWSTSPSSGRS